MKSPYRQYFYPTIWERGRDYFQQGHISNMDIEYQGDSIEIEATVEGTTDYQVFLTFLEGDVVEAGCDCPFAEEGHYCKHMVAVCFAFEEGAKQSRPVPLMPSKQESIESLLEAMSEETLREFCLQSAQKDIHFEQALRRFLSAEKGQFSLDNALDEVDFIIESYQDHGFIDYEESFGFEDEMTDFLGDCL
ncbi:SWIM zinc finger family protein [Streptococcus cuniculi]|nr:SWIM zinc finger family protein [Streptococcus cuniculi]MBF0777837.1 SWIM zinc finger family protein [Streptococcus cuniculi]